MELQCSADKSEKRGLGPILNLAKCGPAQWPINLKKFNERKKDLRLTTLSPATFPLAIGRLLLFLVIALLRRSSSASLLLLILTSSTISSSATLLHRPWFYSAGLSFSHFPSHSISLCCCGLEILKLERNLRSLVFWLVCLIIYCN